MTGFLTALAANFIFIGYSIVEAFVFMLAFNCLAPFLNDNIICLPVTNIGYWVTLSLFLIIHFIGGFIKNIVPTLIKVDNK
jgi:hypothetical protein